MFQVFDVLTSFAFKWQQPKRNSSDVMSGSCSWN